MKRTLYKFLSCAMLLVAAVGAYAENGILETRNYTICPGDTMHLSTRWEVVSESTILYDTLLVATTEEDSIIAYVVNVYPPFEKDEYKRLRRGDTYEWQDTTIADPGVYERIYHTKEYGCDSIYRLHVSLVIDSALTFTLCDGESVTFNGRTYTNAGVYEDILSGDTIYTITVVKHPSQLYLQTATLDATHPYLWQYYLDGEWKTDTIYDPGIYEYTTQNPETGCNDIWRLILTKDEATYHFIETVTICEDEEFSWRGRTGLNKTGIGQTTHYYDRYRTAADQDSIYELILTVRPVTRTTRTIPFCGSFEWKGITYTESTVIVDTLTSTEYNCDSIVTTIFRKGIAFEHHDTLYLTAGETIVWHGMTFNQDGHYEDRHTSSYGCDSVYTLDLILKPAPVATNTLTEYQSICQGEYVEWRGEKYYNPGTYIDTVLVSGTTDIDSLYILVVNQYPTYAWSERVTFLTFPTTYREQVIPAPGEYVFTYQSTYGCDSIITAYIDQEVYRDEKTVIICPGEVYIWDYDGLTYKESGKYTKTETDIYGNDSVTHILNLTVKYIPETRITKTICRGESFTFGDKTYTESGVYTYTFHETGCDSTVVLSLNVVNPDTIKYVHHMNPGDAYVWHSETYRDAGVHIYTTTNQYGCDSTEILILTINHVDTIDTTAVICPGETIEWHGIVKSQSGTYTNPEEQPDGSFNFYRLHLTVLELQEIEKEFVVCGDATVTFNGKTYSEAGYFYDKLGCDTLVRIHVTRLPIEVYETQASLSDDHGYSWTYWENGEQKTDVFTTADTYEFESPNPTTGCNDIWRLILTKDETSYHFVETLTICEGDDFSWHGLENLSRVTGTNTYLDEYKTRAGKDSIYELRLTVVPIERTVRTITFCGEFVWKGTTYSESAVVYDTTSLSTGCYKIERINLDKAQAYFFSSSKDLPQGEVLHWHGQDITTDGVYRAEYTTINGCDSIYEITVSIIPATPETNQYAEELSTCEGDTIVWRDKNVWRSGTYVDTVYKAGTGAIDSIFTLKFTVWPSPKDTIYRHLYTCGGGSSIRYNGKDYYENDTIVTTFHTIHGCDSTVKVYLHFNTALFLSDTVEITDQQLPYTWNYRLGGVVRDTVLTNAGTYNHTEPAEGTCVNQEQLVLIVYPTYLFEDSITICESKLPYYWLDGPADHADEALRHTIGTTKQYEYRYQSVNMTDSIYRLYLTIEPAPKDTIQIYFCEGEQVKVGKNTYYKIKSDSVYRDTLYVPNPDNSCDSIIYYDIYQYPTKKIVETVILPADSVIEWKGNIISGGGTYNAIPDSIDEQTGCTIIQQLRVIQEFKEETVICTIDTGETVHPDKRYPYVWPQTNESYNTTGIYYDSIYDTEGFLIEYHTLYLTITQPYDTTIYVHGCMGKGVVWRDVEYKHDTTFVERVEVDPYTPDAPCDSVFHVTIKIDTVYSIRWDTTLCEYQLPLIVGRVNPDTIWEERPFKHEDDSTTCGCDSIIEGYLTIIPSLHKNDSTFICEGDVVTLGDLEHPAFLDHDGNKWEGKWEGKWHGVTYTEDTIVWDCDHRYFHHIIRRPTQKIVPEKTLYLCPDDSLQLFWPYDTTWFWHDTTYLEHRPMDSIWTDTVHGITYKNDAYTCDSVTRWFIKKLPRYHKDTTAHRLLGDSIWWGGAWRYYTGTYDSIAQSPDTNSFGDTCLFIYPLHLIMDSAYYFRDTVEICSKPHITHEYIWPETGHKQFYTVGDKDTLWRHYYDSLITYDRRDSVYDLCVNYHMIVDTLIFDTICEDTRYRFDSHHGTVERWVDKAGRYVDTLTALNGCDSIVTLQLFVRPRVVTKPKEVMITDREIPYLWKHSWWENGVRADSTDTLRATGLYTFLMPSIHGCDSIDSLYLTVHQTHVFRDTIDVCAPLNKTLKYTWSTGYVQTYTTPLADDSVLYADTLETRIKYDSIYVLCVNFHHIDEKLIRDTICEGGQYRFDIHRGTTTIERWVNTAGTYRDTIENRFGCDSIITLKLFVRDRVPVTRATVHIPDTAAPYLWKHSWWKDGNREDSTQILSASGEYGFVMPNIHGCDSIDSLTLVIHNTYRIQEDSLVICHDQTPYIWQDRNDITATGDFEFHALTHDGYDSIRYVHITVLPILKTVLTDTLCEGDSLQFGLTKHHSIRFVNKTGVYYDTLTSHQYGCDSIIELRLNVYDKYFREYTKHISVADTPYVWAHVFHGDTIARDTLHLSGGQTEGYTYTFTSVHGCDSIDSLTLHVHQTYLYRDSVTICYNETPYSWEGITDIYTTDEYIKQLRTHDGYDSIHVRYVEVLPVLRTTITHTICEGDSLRFGLTKLNKERFLHDAGVYYDTLLSNQFGCDSIIELRLNIYPKYSSHSTVDIADTQLPYEWKHIQGGNEIATELLSGAGEYVYHFTTTFGCDSVDSLSLRVHQTYTIKEDTIDICSDATPFTWCDYTNITESGEYIYHGQTADGYDSTRIVYINVWPVKYTTMETSICEGDSIRFGLTRLNKERFLYDAGTYYDTLVTSHGCDSIITLHLNVYPKYRNHNTVDIADTQLPYEWKHIQGGNEIATELLSGAGEYVYHFTTTFGCDSVDSLSLRVHQTYTIKEDTIDICSDATPLTWCDYTNITESGEYIYHGQTVDGYDSTRIVYINVWKVKYTTMDEAVCKGTTYKFNGKDLTEQGTYVDTLKTNHGCDSIVTLHLTVHEPFFSNRVEHILEGQSVEFFGDTYNTTGTYYHYGTTPTGCDSTSVLQLFVHKEVDTVVTVCKDDLPYLWVYKWDGSVTPLYTAGIYRNDTTYVDGERMFYGLQLIVNEPVFTTVNAAICQGTSYKFNGKDLMEQGTYIDTLLAANGCDSIVRLVLTVHEEYFNSRTEHIIEGQSIEFFGDTYTKTGTYYHYGITPAGCDSTSVLQLFVHNEVDTIVKVCKDNLPYLWVNKWDKSVTPLYTSGIYRNDTTYVDGEQMFYGLQLIVNEPVFTTVQDSICEGSEYRFGGRLLSEQGTYNDTLVAANGCDSIVTLILKVQPIKRQVDYKTIFEGDSVEFYGEYYKESGIYEHKEPNSMSGCEDVYQLVLTVLKEFQVDTMATICNTDLPFVWRGYEYSESGDYKLTTVTDSSRVTTTLHLTVNYGFYGERSVDLCEGSTYIFRGVAYTENTIFYDTIPSRTGCDSIIKYIVSVHPTYDRIDTVHISDQQTYEFNGKILDKSGDYEFTSSTIHGCDSMFHLHLVVHPSYYFYESVELCQPDTLHWHGQIIDKSDLVFPAGVSTMTFVYGDSLLTHKYGFDSIYTLTVNVHPSYYINEKYEIVDGYSTKIHGIDISTPGVYEDTLTSIYGCDSIYHIVVNSKRVLERDTTVDICEGEYYNFYGKKLTKAGVYTYIAPDGSEIIHLTLNVYQSSLSKKQIVITEEDLPYIYNGKFFEPDVPTGDEDVKSTVFMDSLINRYGCDSIVRIEFIVTTHYSDWTLIPLCAGSALIIDRDTITKAGQYVFLRRDSKGKLDSLYRVEAYDAPAYELPPVRETICQGDSVEFDGKYFKHTGTYRVTEKTADGCDSILTLILTVNPAARVDTIVRILSEELPFVWEGRKYYNTGTYELVWHIDGGCDSTRVLHLTVISPDTLSKHICEGQAYNWRGHTYEHAGTYTDTVYDVYHHATDIYMLHLYVDYPTDIISAKVSETDVCADAKGFDIEFVYDGLRPMNYSIYFDAYALKAGFENVYDQPFDGTMLAHVILPATKVEYDEDSVPTKKSYVRPDYYTMQLALDNGVCGISYSEPLKFMVKYPSWIIEQNWDDVVAPLKKEKNGGYEFTQTDWYVNGILQPNNGLGYLHNDKLKVGDEVVMMATRKGESYSIPTCPLIITTKAPDVYTDPILVYPTSAPHAAPRITIEAPRGGSYAIYSSQGIPVGNGELSEGKQHVTLPNTSGIYFIRTVQGNEVETHKVVLY